MILEGTANTGEKFLVKALDWNEAARVFPWKAYRLRVVNFNRYSDDVQTALAGNLYAKGDYIIAVDIAYGKVRVMDFG